MRKILLLSILLISPVLAVDISNPQNLMFVADRVEKFIDVVDLNSRTVVHRIETEYLPQDLLATPYAPILVYTNRQSRVAVFYNLKDKQVAGMISLPLVPRHMVLDTTGAKIGITDSQDGGFALVSAYTRKLAFALDDFPPTTDVLFDPNDIDIYYSNARNGALGLLDMNARRRYELPLQTGTEASLSSPSRSLDGRYVYVADFNSGSVYSINTWSREITQAFAVGARPARPYTTPAGIFLYLMDQTSGRFQSFEQHQFKPFTDLTVGKGINTVTVGRFDRMNLLLGTGIREYYILDNNSRGIVNRGELVDVPLGAQGSVDGRTTWIAFSSIPQVAAIDLETNRIEYISATNNGAGAWTVGLTNNVCH